MIGSPIVFQTAPPQPSSNALATWPYVFVGGPDASQKGFGLWMPAKLVRRSAIGQPFVNLLCGLHTFCRGVDNLRSAIRTISAHKHLRMVARNRELIALALSDRHDHHITRDHLAALRRAHLNAGGRAVAVAQDALRCRLESESTAVAFGELVLVVIARHVGLATPVYDCRRGGAEPFGLRDRVDCRVACANYDDALSHLGVAIGMRLQVLDKRQCIDHAGQVLARNTEPLGAPQSYSDEDGIIFGEQFLDRFHRYACPELHTEVENVPYFRERHIGLELVLGDAVGIEAAGLRFRFEDGDRMPKAPQLARARQARRPGADDGDGLSGWGTGLEQPELVLEDVIRRVPLQ